jgi:hypothetical protein
MSDRYRNPEDVARRGKEIYQKDLRALVEPEHIGEFLTIDVETGDYEIDPDEGKSIDRAVAKRPEGVRYTLRIGHPFTFSFGGSSFPGAG